MIIKQDKYEVGDKVKIVELDALKKCARVNRDGAMDHWAGKTMTIRSINYDARYYSMQEDKQERPIHGGWWWFPNMIAGKVVDTITYKGKEYREVKRKAKVGELIKIVNAKVSMGKYIRGNIFEITELYPNRQNQYGVHVEGVGKLFIGDDEYVVLEPIENKQKRVEILNGCENMADYPKHFNVEYDPKSGQVKSMTEVCTKCGQPLPKPKRKYTAEQIQEAKDIVCDIFIDRSRRYREISIARYDKTTSASMDVFDTHTKHRLCASTTCSDADEYNEYIGVMVALCKLTGEPMPSWVRGE